MHCLFLINHDQHEYAEDMILTTGDVDTTKQHVSDSDGIDGNTAMVKETAKGTNTYIVSIIKIIA